MRSASFYDYIIYEDGKVINKYGRELTKRNNKGRYEVKLSQDGKRKNYILARLVYYLFKGFDINNKDLCVVYKDGNTLNVHIDNLELKHRKDLIQGDKHKSIAKISYEDAIKIRELYKGKSGTNQHDKQGYSLRDLANMYGVTKENIKMIVDGKTHNRDNYKLK